MALLKAMGLALALYAVSAVDATCQHPPPASGYTNAAYSGLWFEIGRIQTAGGASYQKDCICDISKVSSNFPDWGDAAVTYECRMYTPDANVTSIDGILRAGETPGNFAQRFPPFLKWADYNVIWLDEEVAMEYDCRSDDVSEEYCVHIMSRTTSIDAAKLQTMIEYAEGLGLNPQNIAYFPVIQDGCW